MLGNFWVSERSLSFLKRGSDCLWPPQPACLPPPETGHGPGSSVLRLLSYHNHLPCPAQFQSLLRSIQLLPSRDYLPLHEGFAEQQLTLPPKAGDCRVDTWRSPRRASQHWGCGCEIASLPPKISFSPFSSGHKRGPAHVQAAMDGYRKLL